MEALSIKEIVKAIDGVLISGNEEAIITTVSTNSKEIGNQGLFVPIKGEKVDGHQYINNAFENGAIAVFTSGEITDIKEDKIYIRVSNTLKSLQTLASYYRDKFGIPVIGVTGSVGKTTTKEMIATVLESKYKVLKTSGNMNSQIGVPLMMFQIDKSHEIAVIEMGMSEFGEMERLSSIAKPTIAVMTNIGVSHIAQLKTQKNIRKEKLNIINEFVDSSILFVNGNDKLLNEIYEASQTISKINEKNTKIPQNVAKIDMTELTHNKFLNTRVYSYGTEKECNYKADNINTVGNGTRFTFYSENGMKDIELGVLGEHNVFNAVVALAIAEHFEVPFEDANESLKVYRPIAMRGQIEEVHGIQIIDDTYNASPDSIKSGISMLLEMPSVKRKIAVLADVRELGEYSYQLHYEVGEFIAGKNINLVVTIGNEAKAIAKAISEKDKNIQTVTFDENQAAIKYLKEYLQEKDAVLIKGSRGMHTEEIVIGMKEK